MSISSAGKVQSAVTLKRDGVLMLRGIEDPEFGAPDQRLSWIVSIGGRFAQGSKDPGSVGALQETSEKQALRATLRLRLCAPVLMGTVPLADTQRPVLNPTDRSAWHVRLFDRATGRSLESLAPVQGPQSQSRYRLSAT